MASGFFDDGSVQVELGEHVFGAPAAARRSVLLERPDAGGVLLGAGGGVQRIELTGQRLRANLGDAERYVYELLRSLAAGGAGDLGFEDARGMRVVFPHAVFASGTGIVEGLRLAQIETDWLAPEREAEGATTTLGAPPGAWGRVPNAPATYGGTSTQQAYAAGGVSLGTGGSMRIEAVRRSSLREVPRCRGARAGVPSTGAHLRLTVTTSVVAQFDHLAAEVRDIARAVGPGPVALTANGNTYADVLPAGVRPAHTDGRQAVVAWDFVREVG